MEESREDQAHALQDEVQRKALDDPQPMRMRHIGVNTPALSTIAQAILEALEIYEKEWRILARHEVVLSSPATTPGILETQKQFDEYRDSHVIVQTVDPFKSNRTLKGQLVDRNSMDLLLNIKGRLVTVPLNFVRCVHLAPGRYGTEGEDEEAEEDENADSEVYGELQP